jgi:hypothetical protein
MASPIGPLGGWRGRSAWLWNHFGMVTFQDGEAGTDPRERAEAEAELESGEEPSPRER